MSTATNLKAAEAGIDMLDTSISSMSMTYGHSATEAVVAMLQDTPRDSGLDLELLEEISAYFREVRKKYAKFEGSLKGIDSRILVAQVPGGMLTNMENQLREQGAEEKFDAVLEEIPKVRKDLGYIPLVTPTSQIVGTQAVLNVLQGERYKSITKETAGVLKGEYGASPAEVNLELQARVLDGGDAVTCRPADLLSPEMDKLTNELEQLANDKGIELASDHREDVLIHALFPQIGLKFLENRNNPEAFEPAPGQEAPAATPPSPAPAGSEESYLVTVNGRQFNVAVAPGGAVTSVAPNPLSAQAAPAAATSSQTVAAPLAGNIFKLVVQPGQAVQEGQVLIILEAMKMETEIKAPAAGTVQSIAVAVGDSVKVGDPLVALG
jgi:oxaloacetate decarboxylase alpha subunit